MTRNPYGARHIKCAGLMAALLSVAACGPSEQQKAKLAEQKRLQCLDHFCEGDIEPKHNPKGEVALKLNGQWFIGPREYFSTGINGYAFYWPSKTPSAPGERDFPERRLVTTGRAEEVTITIFLRSNNIPAEPRGYRLIEMAQTQGWIAERKALRPGLEAITMKHVIGPQGHYIDHVTYYVATQLKDLEGLPPVGACNHDHPSNGGGTGFMWQPGIWAGMRMNQKHCADWPEIYQEVMHVLQQLRRA